MNAEIAYLILVFSNWPKMKLWLLTGHPSRMYRITTILSSFLSLRQIASKCSFDAGNVTITVFTKKSDTVSKSLPLSGGV